MGMDSAEKQDKVGKFVDREVYLCQSSLVGHLFEKEVFSYDEIENMYLSDEQILDYAGEVNKDSTEEERQDVIQNWRDDGQDMQEVFEWWVVSDWLVEKLKNAGEPILENDYGTWWGRTCTGQAILLDSIIENIYDNLNAA